MEVGQFTPKRTKKTELLTGEVGYLCANMREVADVKIGDTLTDAVSPTSRPFPGYKEVKPLVFCGLYPTDTGRYEDLRDALVKLRLNDSSFVYEPETSLALGIRISMRLLGPAPHGDHSGAARTRIGSDAPHHRADRRLSCD